VPVLQGGFFVVNRQWLSHNLSETCQELRYTNEYC